MRTLFFYKDDLLLSSLSKMISTDGMFYQTLRIDSEIELLFPVPENYIFTLKKDYLSYIFVLRHSRALSNISRFKPNKQQLGERTYPKSKQGMPHGYHYHLGYVLSQKMRALDKN